MPRLLIRQLFWQWLNKLVWSMNLSIFRDYMCRSHTLIHVRIGIKKGIVLHDDITNLSPRSRHRCRGWDTAKNGTRALRDPIFVAVLVSLLTLSCKWSKGVWKSEEMNGRFRCVRRRRVRYWWYRNVHESVCRERATRAFRTPHIPPRSISPLYSIRIRHLSSASSPEEMFRSTGAWLGLLLLVEHGC